MEWLERQADAELIGAIGREHSGNGAIEIDGSSRFHVLQKPCRS